MKVEPEFGDIPIEDDPTGMRRLLAGLPDPGPMPDDLTARILASIATEAAARQAREASAVPDVPRSERDAPVIPIPHRPGRRNRTPGSLRWLAAAAAVAVLSAGGFGMLRLLGGELGGGSPAGQAFGSTAKAGDREQGQLSGSTDTGGAPMEAAGRGFVLALSRSGTDYSTTTLATQARSLLGPVDGLRADSGSLPLATPEGARACVGALGVTSFSEIRADAARVDGVDAIVLLVRSGQAWSAYAVPLTCGDGSPVTALAGPVPLR